MMRPGKIGIGQANAMKRRRLSLRASLLLQFC
jgi:hypothetical protein